MSDHPFNSPYLVKVHNVDLKERPFEAVDAIDFTSASGKQVVVEPGYRSDFASVPWFFRRVVSPVGRHGKAAFIHDKLCDETPHTCDYLEAANIFNEALVALGVRKTRRKIMVTGVKIGGPKFKKETS